eukprot:COSAG01_NODE_5510_length_4211_cov_5.337549_5_plen_108_part_00
MGCCYVVQYTAVGFSVVYFFGVLKQAWEIYKHETSHIFLNQRFLDRYKFLKQWSGCQWEAEVEPDGTVGTPKTTPGGITDFSDARRQSGIAAPKQVSTDNPLANPAL